MTSARREANEKIKSKEVHMDRKKVLEVLIEAYNFEKESAMFNRVVNNNERLEYANCEAYAAISGVMRELGFQYGVDWETETATDAYRDKAWAYKIRRAL